VRGMTVEALKNLGYSVMAASGAEQAIELLESGAAPQLLFTDVVMPGMNGRALADRIKDKRPDIKVLYTSGYARGNALYDGILDRGAAFLPKPFTVDQLAAKVRSTLDGPPYERTSVLPVSH
jgi:CheY-like chemotaxis protein